MIATALVIKDNKILLGKLRPDKQEEFGGIEYIFPGGKVEENETPEQTAVREVLEETGLKVKVIKQFAERKHPQTGVDIKYFHCKFVSGDLDVSSAENDDIDQIIWVERRELRKYIPFLWEVIENYLGEVIQD